MSRPRKHIPLTERLAMALACLLPQEQRDDLRARKVPAKSIISLFEADHIVLHALGGSDFWWNLHPTLRMQHREKSRRDTSICAKVKRLQYPRVAKTKIAARPNPWPPRGVRKLQSRPFERVLK